MNPVYILIQKNVRFNANGEKQFQLKCKKIKCSSQHCELYLKTLKQTTTLGPHKNYSI